MASKRIVLTAEEREIEHLIASGQTIPVSEEKKAAMLAAVHRKVESLKHGGARPGAGRKPVPVRRVQISATVAPQTARLLRSLAKKEKASLGVILDRLGAQAKR